MAPSSDVIRAHSPANYEIFFELGRGGMGSAYLARTTGAEGFGRLVVIKRILAELSQNERMVRRFVDEAKVTASVHHANVVGIQQVGADEHGHFIVLDYIEGGSLEELLARAGLRQQRVPPPIALRIALDALSGLEAVHGAKDVFGRRLGILHRDISLQNILVGRDGVARVTDFGVAKSALNSVSTDQKYIVGKLVYLPPEYLSRQAVGPNLDVYAVGTTLWMALTGEEPFPNMSEGQILFRIVKDGLPPLSERIQIAPMIERIVMKACDGNRETRYQSASEMASDIESLGFETGWIATRAEVVEWVESLLGFDLERRRERLAKWIQASPEPNQPAAKQPSVAAISSSAAGAVTTSKPKSKKWLVALAVALVVVSSAFFMWPQRQPEAAQSGFAEAAGMKQGETPISAAPPAGARPGPSVEEPKEPLVDFVSPASAEATPAAAPESVRKPRARRDTPASTAPPPSAVRADRPLRAPDDISVDNPYR